MLYPERSRGGEQHDPALLKIPRGGSDPEASRPAYLSHRLIRTGYIQELEVLRRNKDGLILGDEDGELLLPNAEVPDAKQGMLSVFVYRGPDGKLIAPFGNRKRKWADLPA